MPSRIHPRGASVISLARAHHREVARKRWRRRRRRLEAFGLSLGQPAPYATFAADAVIRIGGSVFRGLDILAQGFTQVCDQIVAAISPRVGKSSSAQNEETT